MVHNKWNQFSKPNIFSSSTAKAIKRCYDI